MGDPTNLLCVKTFSGVTFFGKMVLLEGDQFLSRLTLMFDKARSKGHVQLTMKRYDGKTKPTPRPENQKDVNRFQLAYCNLLKSNMDGLKRQKKTKTKKA